MQIDKLKEQLWQAVHHLPWQTHTISLLLDGINVDNLLHRFYTQKNQSTFEVLYLQTRFAELYEVSPCLVKIDNTNNPHLVDYINNLEKDWGYILISDTSWEKQIKHLRDLLIVKLPNVDEQVILKIADPLVAKALFGFSQSLEDLQFFGPFSQIYTSDIIDSEVNIYHRPDKEVMPLELPYRLTEEQNNILDEVEIKRANQLHYQHMKTYFTKFLDQYSTENRKKTIDELVKQSLQRGYSSPMEQTYFLNIFGYLGANALQDYPEIASLVEDSTLGSIRAASILAEQQAKELAKGI